MAEVTRDIQGGWPVVVSSSAPWMSFLRPSPSYVRRDLISKMPRMALAPALNPTCPRGGTVKCAEYEVQVGVNDEDYALAVRAMKSWKMCDALKSAGDAPSSQ